jgi:hypothetical protein
VVEDRTQPVRRGVALIARGREAGLHVVRISGALEIHLVTGVAGRACRQAVRTRRAKCRVVALRTLQAGVCTGQSEARRRVIEGRTQPVRRGVTLLAGGRESSLYVIRVRRPVEVSLMALHARRGIGEVIRSAWTKGGVMALRALQRGVEAIERKPGARVVEISSAPIRGAVTLLTGGREPSLYMVRIRRPVEIGLMALHAGRGSGQVIRAARAECRVVALGALQRGVEAVEREAGARMVEGCIQPVCGAVALLASRGESRLHVIRIRRPVEIGLMALHAGRGSGQVIRAAWAERRVVALGAL